MNQQEEREEIGSILVNAICDLGPRWAGKEFERAGTSSDDGGQLLLAFHMPWKIGNSIVANCILNMRMEA